MEVADDGESPFAFNGMGMSGTGSTADGGSGDSSVDTRDSLPKGANIDDLGSISISHCQCRHKSSSSLEMSLVQIDMLLIRSHLDK